MKALIRCDEARALDASIASSWALPEGALMESAALGLWLALAKILGTDLARTEERIVVVAGSGNNGGDALALARHAAFAGCRQLTAIVPSAELRALVACQAASLAAGGIPLLRAGSPEAQQAIAQATLIVDGIAGTGLTGSLRGEARELVSAINAARAPVLSIDLPSGFRDAAGPDDPVIEADWTLSIVPTKKCLYLPAFRPRSGSIIEIEDVFPAEAGNTSLARLLDPSEYLHSSSGSVDSHKGQRGRVGVLAGSPGMAGAALLAVRAAQAAGAGLVTLYTCPELFASLGAGQAGEALGGAIVKLEASLRDDRSRLDSVLAGPGWVPAEGQAALLSWLLESGLPLVLDAGALAAASLAAAGEAASLLRARQGKHAPLILTPHPGELSALSGIAIPELLADPEPTLRAACERFDATIILKSSTSWMRSPAGEIRVLDGREPGLGVAGSGDVLSGLTAGLLARDAAGRTQFLQSTGLDIMTRAACLHLLAGRQARAELGWFDAFSLIPALSRLCGRPQA